MKRKLELLLLLLFKEVLASVVQRSMEWCCLKRLGMLLLSNEMRVVAVYVSGGLIAD